jgi:hypothetical protein
MTHILHIHRDGFTGGLRGGGGGGGGGVHPPSPGQGGAIFHDKAKNYKRQNEIQ